MYDFEKHVTHLFPFQPTEELTVDENSRLRQVCVLVINVKRSTERLELIKKQLEPLQLNTFVFGAVDAAQLVVTDTHKPEIKVIEYNNIPVCSFEHVYCALFWSSLHNRLDIYSPLTIGTLLFVPLQYLTAQFKSYSI
jgi:hypothetical protein